MMTLLACAALLGVDTPAPVHPWEVPGITRSVSADGRVVLEVRDPHGRFHPGPSPPTFPVTFRLVELGEGVPTPASTSRAARETGYRELDSRDRVLGVGELPWRPDSTAILDGGAGIAIAGFPGVWILAPDGALRRALEYAELFGETNPQRERDNAWLRDASGVRAGPERSVGLWVEDGGLVVARYLAARRWALARVDLETGAVRALPDDDVPPGVDAPFPAVEAGLAVDLAGRREAAVPLTALLANERAPLEARVRAAYWLGRAGDHSGRELVASLVRGAHEEHATTYEERLAIQAAGAVLLPEDAPWLVARLDAIDVPAGLAESAAEFGEAAWGPALELLFAGDPETPPARPLGSAIRLLLAREPAALDRRLEELTAAFAAAPDSRRMRSLRAVFHLDYAHRDDVDARLAGALIRAAHGRHPWFLDAQLPGHEAIVAALIEGFALEPAADDLRRLRYALRRAADAPEAKREWGPSEWTSWWELARDRPQRTQLLALAARAWLDGGACFREELARCIASRDVRGRSVAAAGLVALKGNLDRLRLRAEAERLRDAWDPTDREGQRAWKQLDAFLRQ